MSYAIQSRVSARAKLEIIRDFSSSGSSVKHSKVVYSSRFIPSYLNDSHQTQFLLSNIDLRNGSCFGLLRGDIDAFERAQIKMKRVRVV